MSVYVNMFTCVGKPFIDRDTAHVSYANTLLLYGCVKAEQIHDYALHVRPSLACLVIANVGTDPHQLLNEFEESCTCLGRQAQYQWK